MISDVLAKVIERRDLTAEEAREALREMMVGAATQNQISAFITAMHMKGEREQELLGFARAMRESATRISAPPDAIDISGTGKSGAQTFNISTVASFAVSAAGVPVAKHGNRGISNRSGSADMLDALGIPFDLAPPDVEDCIVTTGFGFMFSPVFHSSMRNIHTPEREIGLGTFLNILEPLSNPARVKAQIVGVHDPAFLAPVARILRELGVSRAMVVNGCGLDEITVTGRTKVAELRDGTVKEYEINPRGFGFLQADQVELAGGTPADNARIALSILRGERTSRRDVVVLNAGAALYVSGRVEKLDQGVELASAAIASGKAYAKLEEFASLASRKELRRQMTLPPSALSGRRLHPKVLAERCAEVTFELVARLKETRGGLAELQMIEPHLLSEPSVLSVLFLTRSLRMLTNGSVVPRGMKKPSTKLSDAVSREGVSIVSEYGVRSPYTSPLEMPVDPRSVIEASERAGAIAVSVRMEGEYFGGSPELFSRMRPALHLPMLFNDFVTSPRQVEMARALGASAILLVARALRPDALDYLVRSAASAGLEPVVETMDHEDIQKLVSCDSFEDVKMVSILGQDVGPLRFELNRLLELSRLVPNDRILLAEGVSNPQEILKLRGFDAAVVPSTWAEPTLQTSLSDLVLAGRRVSA